MTTIANLASVIGFADRIREELLKRVAPLFGRRYTKGARGGPHVWDMAELCRQQDAVNRATAVALAFQESSRFMVNATCDCPDGLTDPAKACDRCRLYVKAKASLRPAWTREAVREAERQSSANGRLMGYATRIWREQGYGDETVLRLCRGMLAGVHAVQRDLDAERADPGTQPPWPFGGPTARGVAFAVYGSQASGGDAQEAGA